MNKSLFKKSLSEKLLYLKKRYILKFPNLKEAWLTLGLFPLVCFYIVVPNDSLAMTIFSYYLGIFIVPLEFVLEDLMGFKNGSNEWGIPLFIIVPYLSGLALYHLFYVYFYSLAIIDAFSEAVFSKK